jgi:predicted dehydrogenase
MNLPDFSSSPFRLGVVGAGQITGIVLPMLVRHGFAVAGVFDPHAEAASKLTATFPGAQTCEDLDSLLRDPEVEGVYVASPPMVHLAQLEACLCAGKPVILEKPFVRNAEEARLAVDLFRCHPGVETACCASRFRFNAAAAAARTLVADGSLGEIRSVRIHSRVAPLPPLDGLPGWKRTREGAGGGLAADWSVYELDWAGWMLGGDLAPLEVESELFFKGRDGSDLESGYRFRFQLEGGVELELERLSTGEEPKHSQVRIEGTGGGLTLPFQPGSSEPVLWTTEGESREVAPPDADWESVLAGPVLDWARAVREGDEPASGPESQLAVHQCLDRAYAAANGDRASCRT